MISFSSIEYHYLCCASLTDFELHMPFCPRASYNISNSQSLKSQRNVQLNFGLDNLLKKIDMVCKGFILELPVVAKIFFVVVQYTMYKLVSYQGIKIANVTIQSQICLELLITFLYSFHVFHL